MPSHLQDLLRTLELEQVDARCFQGLPDRTGTPRVYGGTVLAQAMQAATQTVDRSRTVHSQHAYFLRPGDPRLPIRYEVDAIRDGGSFSTRRVVALQAGQAILNTALSFQCNEDGFDHHENMPVVDGPEALLEREEIMDRVARDYPQAAISSHAPAIQFCPVTPVFELHPEPRPAQQQIWMRSRGKMPDDPALQRIVLAYMSDSYLLSTTLLPHGRVVFDTAMICASLDHALWFHADFHCDDWLLYVMDSPRASGGRSMSRGSIFSHEGILIASTAQESLVRRRR